MQQLIRWLALACILLSFAARADEAYPSVNLVELYHAASDRYFLSIDAAEVATLVSNGQWQPTGQVFRVSPFTQPATQSPVQRYFHRTLHTHLWTANSDEIAVLNDSPDWDAEGTAFYIRAPGRYACFVLTDERLQFNNLSRFYHPVKGTHRYVLVTDNAVAERLAAEGWRDEGVQLCVNPYFSY